MPLDYNDLLVFLMNLGWVVKGIQFGDSLRMKCKSNWANTDLRVKWLISPGSGSVYVTPRCHSFTRSSCAFVLCLAVGEQEKSNRVSTCEGP